LPTIEDLKYLQSQPLERKINITITRIIEWYQRWNGQVYVSFSGGKDSTVLLDLARRIYPDIEAVFIDTGLEYPEIREFVKSIDNVTYLRPKMQFKEVIEKYGYPVISKEVAQIIGEAKRGQPTAIKKMNGLDKDNKPSAYRARNVKYKYLVDSEFKISEKCCYFLKKNPVKEFEKKTTKKPILAMMADESIKRAQGWLNTGCNSFESKRPQSNPMAFWTEQDVLRYLKNFNIPYSTVYGNIVAKTKIVSMNELEQLAMKDVPVELMTTGEQRTGCMFCMFGVHLDKEPNRFQRMKITHPKLYDYCMREENGLGLAKVLDYIGVKYD
jgi:3'-phosphoadenosine 5'-phosphosulfate sulfotransferase (PAPS reductase)/FAD synthetase